MPAARAAEPNTLGCQGGVLKYFLLATFLLGTDAVPSAAGVGVVKPVKITSVSVKGNDEFRVIFESGGNEDSILGLKTPLVLHIKHSGSMQTPKSAYLKAVNVLVEKFKRDEIFDVNFCLQSRQLIPNTKAEYQVDEVFIMDNLLHVWSDWQPNQSSQPTLPREAR